MTYAESVARHAAAHPFLVERWSVVTDRWVFVSDAKNVNDAERIIAMRRVTDPDSKYRIEPYR